MNEIEQVRNRIKTLEGVHDNYRELIEKTEIDLKGVKLLLKTLEEEEKKLVIQGETF